MRQIARLGLTLFFVLSSTTFPLVADEDDSPKKKIDFFLKGKPTARPDLDKVLGSIFDALQGTLYYNDSQVVEVISTKHRSTTPRAIISLEELPHGTQIEL